MSSGTSASHIYQSRINFIIPNEWCRLSNGVLKELARWVTDPGMVFWSLIVMGKKLLVTVCPDKWDIVQICIMLAEGMALLSRAKFYREINVNCVSWDITTEFWEDLICAIFNIQTAYTLDKNVSGYTVLLCLQGVFTFSVRIFLHS